MRVVRYDFLISLNPSSLRSSSNDVMLEGIKAAATLSKFQGSEARAVCVVCSQTLGGRDPRPFLTLTYFCRLNDAVLGLRGHCPLTSILASQ